MQGSCCALDTLQSISLQLYKQHNCPKKQLFIPIFLRRICSPKEGMACFRSHGREWLSWLGLVPDQSELCSRDSPRGRTQGINPRVEALESRGSLLPRWSWPAPVCSVGGVPFTIRVDASLTSAPLSLLPLATPLLALQGDPGKGKAITTPSPPLPCPGALDYTFFVLPLQGSEAMGEDPKEDSRRGWRSRVWPLFLPG